MRLTPQQLNFMETFGFLHFPGLIEDRIEAVIAAFEEIWATHGGGHDGRPHDGTARSCIVPFAGQSEYLSSLLDDPRIDGILGSLLGDDYVYLGSDGNYYVGDTGWHSDGGWPRPIVYYKIAFYLDRLTRDSGAIRVIPGSHRYGEGYAEALQAGVRESEEHWGVSGDQVPAVAVETAPGDVVVFHQGTKHSAWGGGDRRRMFTLNCTRRHTEEELPIMRQEVANFSRFLTDSVYGPAMVDTATPERMRHLEQPLANQDHLPELSAQARRERGEPSRG
ncbi:MAG: phytanoyl-CoA dioxygenase family protein [Gemmatimonadaceae bacterium]|nr:phytanoyl-CoA dioxygenase family protein [Gemmatimonadaceae bacterium]